MSSPARRKNLRWIVLLTLIGGATAWVLEYWLAPRYTATGYLEIAQPTSPESLQGGGDAKRSGPDPVTEQHTRARLFLSESTLSTILQDSDFRDTNWFASRTDDHKKPDVRRLKKDLREGLAVRPVEQSALLQVSFTCSDPADCRTIVEKVVGIYLDQEREAARARLDSRSGMLGGLEKSINGQLRTLSPRIENYQTQLIRHGVSTPEGYSDRERELGVLLEAQVRAGARSSAADSRYRQVASLIAKGESVAEVEKAIETDPSVVDFVRNVNALKTRRDVAADPDDKDHADLKRLDRLMELTQAQLDARRQELRVRYTNQLVESLRGESQQARASLDSISGQLDALRSERAELAKEAANLKRFLDQEKSLRERRALIENRLAEIVECSANVDSQMRINWARGGRPETPESRDFPRLFPYVLPGLIIGLVLGLCVGVIRSFVGGNTSTPNDKSGPAQTSAEGNASQ